jgi:hypothetical protein
MPRIEQAAYQAIQPELTSGESILWAAQPLTSVIFHREDFYLIPFSLFWGGFAIVWEGLVTGSLLHPVHRNGGPLGFMMLWGVPFVLLGQYFIWGRFLVAAWKKRRTFYAVTNRRAIVVQQAWGRKTAAAFLDTLPSLIKEGGANGVGTLRFSAAPVFNRGSFTFGAWDGMSVGDTPVFRDIDELEAIYNLVSEQRERLREGKTSAL